MKKNQKTYLLLTVVIGVWGIIGFKVIGAVTPSPKAPNERMSNEVFVPKQVMQRDTFTLMANYRDPFLGTVQAPKKQKKAPPKKSTKPALPEKNIQYSGFITDTDSKEQLFFVTIDGQQQMMKLNDTFKEVKLVSKARNSIKVRYGGSTKTIPLNK